MVVGGGQLGGVEVLEGSGENDVGEAGGRGGD